MSRCFPYPPPGYSLNRDRNEALIEPIKLQREREKSKAERKKGRHREKKEKKREDEQNVTEFGHGEKRKRNDGKTRKSDKNDGGDLKGKYIKNSTKDEAEQLERSGLTEEHEQPVCPQNPCYSSDSTQNSNKRRRPAVPPSPANVICTHGNVLRIRLPSLKLKEPDVSVCEDRPCSTSGRTESTGTGTGTDICHGPSQAKLRSTSVEANTCVQASTPTPKLVSEHRCSTPAGDSLFATSLSTSSEKGIGMVESLYKNLVEIWVPPPLKREQTDDDELEWLFESKHLDGERPKAGSSVLCAGSSTLWPRARYLPDADIYALPFTVPF